MKSKLPIICVDFDGVLHSYSGGWKGPRNIPDAPVPGAIAWLRELVGPGENVSNFFSPRVQVAIYSSRSRYWFGRRAMKRWLLKHGLTRYQLESISFPTQKPPAFLQIDDRAVTFTGTFPCVCEMLEFKPWNKKAKP